MEPETDILYAVLVSTIAPMYSSRPSTLVVSCANWQQPISTKHAIGKTTLTRW